MLGVAARPAPPRPVEAAPIRRPDRRGFAASCLLAAAFAGLYGLALLRRHAQYQTYAYDLGLLTQVTWNTAHGRPFATTLLAFNYLGDHAAPVLALLAPLLLLWPDARALLVVQALAVGAAGVGVFLVARRRCRDTPAALLVQAAYHLAPATAWVALDEFHPIALALPAFAFASAAFREGRLALAALLAGLALVTNEDAATWALPFGLLLVIAGRGRGRRWGALLAAGSALWLGLYLGVAAPHLRPPAIALSDPHPDIGVFIYCGRTWPAIAQCLATRPDLTVHQLLRPEGRQALAALLGPTGGLGLLGPSFLVVLPRWLIHLLSSGPGNYAAHYSALMALAAWLAAAEAVGGLAPGLARAGRWLRLRRRTRATLPTGRPAAPGAAQWSALVPGSGRHRCRPYRVLALPELPAANAVGPARADGVDGPRAARWLAAGAAALSLLAYHGGAPLPGGVYSAPTAAEQARQALLDRAVALVPADPALGVTATSSLLPHLAARPRLELPWADPTPPPDFLVLDLRDGYPLTDAALRDRAARWRADPAYQILLDRDDVLVLRRGAGRPALPRHDLFGGAILLEGERLTTADGALAVELDWRAVAPTGGDYHYFVHLVDAAGYTTSQQDGSPEQGRLDTADWPPGEAVRETLRLAAPPRAQWGQDHLEVGWYDWRSGRRLTLPDGRDHVALALPA